ncbi:Protein IMPACT [Smittium culicis]|uniref:Protein IMPACT n=1 Tax=Smittium culicis TaxID=133412 RepID=A0A1R1XHD5_9FUNG|nr:Protein IMPACT [Smittium culicis]OMJ14065.1 Protein IMPACT [Smittium culicis]
MDTASNIERQLEEILVLESIYGHDFVDVRQSPEIEKPGEFSLFLEIGNLDDGFPYIELALNLPSDYPSSSKPVYELATMRHEQMNAKEPAEQSPLNPTNIGFKSKDEFLAANRFTITDTMRADIHSKFNEIWEQECFEVVIYNWSSWLLDYVLEKWSKLKLDFESSQALQLKITPEIKSPEIDQTEIQAPAHSDPNSIEFICTKHPNCCTIYQGETIVRKKSVFIGFAAAASSEAQISCFKERLLSDKRISRSTHNISAYRIKQSNGYFIQDHDDDGEAAAGKRLQMLLTNTELENVVVMVSRWFGGILLGPERFKLINAAARNALSSSGIFKD